MPAKEEDDIENSADPDQTALGCAVQSGSPLFGRHYSSINLGK